MFFMPGSAFDLLQNGTSDDVKKILSMLNEAEVPPEDVVGEIIFGLLLCLEFLFGCRWGHSDPPSHFHVMYLQGIANMRCFLQSCFGCPFSDCSVHKLLVV